MSNDSILDVVHRRAKDLHNAGLMDAKTLREFDVLCIPPVKEYTANHIRRRRLRLSYKASQAEFAPYLNTSPSTVKQWEQGQKRSNGPSRKLLYLVDKLGLEALG